MNTTANSIPGAGFEPARPCEAGDFKSFRSVLWRNELQSAPSAAASREVVEASKKAGPLATNLATAPRPLGAFYMNAGNRS